MACTFSTSQLPKVVRPWCVLYILTSKCASRHNGVQFLHLSAGSAPAALASLLFDPPEPQIIGKTQCFATFLPLQQSASSFFWDFLFFDFLSSSLLFSDSSHLCFSFVHIVGSLTSKLPSLIFILFHFMFDFISPSPDTSARKWVSRVTLSCRRRSLAESQSWTLTSKCQTCWARCTRHICDDMITELVEAWYKNTAEGLDEASQSISFYFVISKIHGRPIVRPASIPPTHS